MAKAVSGEAGVPFFSISGAEFVEMFVGVGASRVRDLFNQAKKQSGAINYVQQYLFSGYEIFSKMSRNFLRMNRKNDTIFFGPPKKG